MESTRGLHTGSGAERATSTAERITSTVTDAAGRAAAGAQSAASTTASKMDSAAAKAGEQLESAAELIRQKAPDEGRIGTAASAIADGVDQAGSYLQQQGISGALEDVSILIRRYPAQALLVGVGIGYLLARLRAR